LSAAAPGFDLAPMLHSGGCAVKGTTMRRSAIVTLMFATLTSANHGHAEENRGSAEYLLPLCKTWLDFAEKEVETVKDLVGRSLFD
jgi:hypothetical protein